MRILQTGARGKDVVISIHGPGQVFGHAALVKKFGYLCSAAALGRCHGLSWSTDTVWQLMRELPRFGENVLGMLVVQLFHMQDRCLLAGEGVDRRLARTLAQLAFSIGRKSGRSILIDDGFSARDLAELSGTTIFTVSRVLGEWERRGLLNKGRGWVMVHDVGALLSVTPNSQAEEACAAPAP